MHIDTHTHTRTHTHAQGHTHTHTHMHKDTAGVRFGIEGHRRKVRERKQECSWNWHCCCHHGGRIGRRNTVVLPSVSAAAMGGEEGVGEEEERVQKQRSTGRGAGQEIHSRICLWSLLSLQVPRTASLPRALRTIQRCIDGQTRHTYRDKHTHTHTHTHTLTRTHSHTYMHTHSNTQQYTGTCM